MPFSFGHFNQCSKLFNLWLRQFCNKTDIDYSQVLVKQNGKHGSISNFYTVIPIQLVSCPREKGTRRIIFTKSQYIIILKTHVFITV